MDAARTISEQILSEDGTATAISFIDKMATTFSYPWPINQGASWEAEALPLDDTR